MPQLRTDLADAFAGKVRQWDKISELTDSGVSNVMVEQAGRLRAEAAAWQTALETGALWWVSPEMTEVATTAAESVPIGEIGLLDEDADPSGVIFWAGPTGASLLWRTVRPRTALPLRSANPQPRGCASWRWRGAGPAQVSDWPR